MLIQSVAAKQITFPFITNQAPILNKNNPYGEKLTALLSSDLGFHGQDNSSSSHNFHAFPAKFPPQLPRLFIEHLTQPGDLVLDPMLGSGTTVLEAFLLDRQPIGFDIDPLAISLSKTKTTPLDGRQLGRIGHEIISRARHNLASAPELYCQLLTKRWDAKTQEFVDYWFQKETQLELIALLSEIEKIEETAVRAFFQVSFSAIIITKTGGVSRALDLAHTRPHRAKLLFNTAGKLIVGEELDADQKERRQYVTKILRSPIEEFEKRLIKNLESIGQLAARPYPPFLQFGNAQSLPLTTASIDLIVTSPPYAANAIDYMRAHKFSLVWLGHKIDELGQKRKKYIGGEATVDIDFEPLPEFTESVVAQLSREDGRRGEVLRRYYSEMTRSLREMYRVLKPDRAAVVVVGNSTIRGVDTQTAACLADIGQNLGFSAPKIGVRQLERNRRMMPAGKQIDRQSQIQQRMHEEYVIGFLKPEK
jgi:DNA modification methylase